MRDEIKEQFEKGFVGRITYNDCEDSYQLSTPGCDYGLMNSSHWHDYEGQKVKVTIKVEVLEPQSSDEARR